jgi:hypothetical protein
MSAHNGWPRPFWIKGLRVPLLSGEPRHDLGRDPLHRFLHVFGRDGQPYRAGGEPRLGESPEVISHIRCGGRGAAEWSSRRWHRRGDARRGEECRGSERQTPGIACAVVKFAQAASHAGDFCGADAGSVPAIAEAQRTAQGSVAVAAGPYRRASAGGRGHAVVRRVQRRERPGELGGPLCPQGSGGREVVIGAGAAFASRYADRAELLQVPAGTGVVSADGERADLAAPRADAVGAQVFADVIGAAC